MTLEMKETASKRDELVEVASELFYKQGYQATGVNRKFNCSDLIQWVAVRLILRYQVRKSVDRLDHKALSVPLVDFHGERPVGGSLFLFHRAVFCILVTCRVLQSLTINGLDTNRKG